MRVSGSGPTSVGKDGELWQFWWKEANSRPGDDVSNQRYQGHLGGTVS